MREASAVFRDIKLLGIDNLKIETIPGVGNMVMVPFTLSPAPSEGWTQYFISNAPKDAEAKIKGDRALYKCPKDKEIIKGECLLRATDHRANSLVLFLGAMRRGRPQACR